jgi:hypothetical protein
MEAYLVKLRARLRGMHVEDVQEIIAELRSHITEKATENGVLTLPGVEAALVALGSPERLASEYTTDDLLARAKVSRSPLRILGSLFHWASLSIAGFFVLVGTILGYSLGVVSVLAAFAKPFHPHAAGLWLIPGGDDVEISLHLGGGTAPAVGREVLGWWIVPLGLVVGCALALLTTRFALWFVRRYRASRTSPLG